MRDNNITEHRTLGATILERFKALPASAEKKEVAPYAKAFANEHAQYEKASKLAETAQSNRESALKNINKADNTLDLSVEQLARKMIGANLGKRTNPFDGISPYAPSKLTNLAYATEAKEVRNLLAKLAKTKPPKEVAQAAAACLKNVANVEAALSALTKPQAIYTKALSDRDALLPAWQKALSRFEKHAAAAWDDDDALVKELFAPPESVQAPRAKRTKKTKSKSGGESDTGSESGHGSGTTPPSGGSSSPTGSTSAPPQTATEKPQAKK